jgi:hypothetical protein
MKNKNSLPFLSSSNQLEIVGNPNIEGLLALSPFAETNMFFWKVNLSYVYLYTK